MRHLKEARSQGYEINLMYLWLSTPEQAIKRVAQRVVQGGHDVPAETIRRRYYVGIKNLLKLYLPLADSVVIFDNSMEESEKIVARKNVGHSLEIVDKIVWEEIQRIAHA